MKRLLASLLMLTLLLLPTAHSESDATAEEYWYLSRLISEAGEYLPVASISEFFEINGIDLAVGGKRISDGDAASYVVSPKTLNVDYALSNNTLPIEGANDLNDPVISQKYTCVYTRYPTLAAVPVIEEPKEDWLPEGEYFGSALMQGGKVRSCAAEGIRAVFDGESVRVAAGGSEITVNIGVLYDVPLLDPTAVHGDSQLRWLLNGYDYIFLAPTQREDTITALAADKNGTLGFVIYLSRDAHADEQGALSVPEVWNGFSDAAFESGVLNCREYEWPKATSKNLSIDMPESAWTFLGGEKQEIPDELLDAALAMQQPVMGSVSPTGNSGIAALNDAPLAYYEGGYHVIYPSLEKSVDDEYDNFAYWYTTFYRAYTIGAEGVTYSPNGRYAVTTNNRNVIINSNFKLADPILIDLSTGEAILTATYGNSIARDGAGAVLSACFSFDSTKLYYMLFRGGGKFSLMCYDIGSNTTATLMNAPYGLINTVYGTGLYYGRLCLTAEGSFLISNSVSKSNLHEGITEIRHEFGPVYSLVNHMYPLPLKYGASCDLLVSSPLSGRVLAPYGQLGTFMCCDASNGYCGIEDMWAVKADTYEVVRVTIDDLLLVSEVSHYPALKPDYIPVLKAVLSPEGDYALLYVSRMGSGALLMVRLEDMRVLKIREVTDDEIPSLSNIIENNPVIEWNSEKLSVRTADGIKSFVFE